MASGARGSSEELGIEPSRELLELQALILRQDPSLLVGHRVGRERDASPAPRTRHMDSGGVHIAYQVVDDGEPDILFRTGTDEPCRAGLGGPGPPRRSTRACRDRAADPVRQAPRRLVRAREAMGRFERMAVSPSTYLRMLRLIHEIDVATRS